MESAFGIFHRSLRDLVRKEVLAEVLVTGIVLMVVWFGIGWLFWDKLLNFTSMVISWVPFSIIKANGALLVLFLIWALAVLVSYAFITAIIAPLIFRRINKGYYYYSFSALLGFAIFWGWIFLTKWSILKDAIANKLLVWLPFQTVADGSALLLNFYIFYSFYILSLFLVLSLYQRTFLNTIKELEYPDLELEKYNTDTGDKIVAFKDALIFIVLTILLFPLLLVPIINVLIQLFLWAWLYRDANFRGICKTYCSEDEFNRLKEHKATIWSIAFFASILNFVPIINIFTPFFAQIVLFHWIIQNRLESKK